ncbi:MAG: hypothetical protein JWM01_1723 [Arthrobacter sp.]|nr:hypothetical protein [Arthrobacter sp.]
MGNKALDRGTEFCGIARRQIDFITDAVESKADSLIRGSPIQIINEDDFYFLCHKDSLSKETRVANAGCTELSILRFAAARQSGKSLPKGTPQK